MFDSLVTATAGAVGASAVCAWTRVESAACARRVFGMVDLLDAAYAADPYAVRDQWCLDNWSAVCAHLGAAMTVTSGTVSRYLLVGTVLRQRYPTIAAMFLAGQLTYPMVAAIVTRTNLAIDPEVYAKLDAILAEQILGWAPMSIDKTEKTIDALLAELDPQAVHRAKTKARSRGVDLRLNAGSGIAELFITLFAHDAEAFYKKVTAMAATVCPADPRTIDQRRADATGALANGADRLACLCGDADCPAPDRPPASSVVVHVVVRQETLTDPAAPTPTPYPDAPEPTAPDPNPTSGESSETDECARTTRNELRPNQTQPRADDDCQADESDAQAEALAQQPRVLSQLGPGYPMARPQRPTRRRKIQSGTGGRAPPRARRRKT